MMERYQSKTYRIAALGVAVFMLLLFVFTGGLQAQHAGHSCQNEPCTICIHVNESVKRIGELGALLLSFTGALIIMCFVERLLEEPELFFQTGRTPVRLKTRMDH